ncbi:MAG: hypothetical protein ACLGXA_10260 [Acidobacteriota bacterium]
MRSDFSRIRLNWVSALGILCIGLVLVSGMAQAAHFHASGTADRDCALCVAAHQLAHTAPAITLGFSSRAVATLMMSETEAPPRRAVFFRLVSRPPPSGIAVLA